MQPSTNSLVHFQTVKLFTMACACSLAATLCVSAIAFNQEAQQKTDAERSQQTPSLTPSERRGRAIYLRGQSSGKGEITAVVGELEVPATSVNCAGCHGRRGEGKTEGGVTAGNLTWANLTKPYGHKHSTGRNHGPFNESSFATAVVRGVDPSGNNLMVAMPRYRMSIEDMNDLLAYIKRMEFDRDPGVTSDSIDVGIPLPTSAALATTGDAIRQVTSAYFDDLNAGGGIYNRKVKLHFTESGATDLSASLRSLTTQNEIFAFIGGISAGADKQINALAREQEIPFIGPATLLPQIDQPPNRYVFYLLPGVNEQAVALVNFADQQLDLKKLRSAVVFPNTELSSAAAEATLTRAKEVGWSNVVKMPYTATNFDANTLAQQLKTDGTVAVFIFGSGNDVETFLRAANALNWNPYIFSLGILASKDLPNSLPFSFTKKVFLTFPTVPGDVTADGLAEYRRLADKYKLPPQHTTAQLAALAAAKTFVEGLKRVGADLSREQLVSALESLYDYDTGLTPKLIFGPNKRVGAAGAYVITINSDTKNFEPVGGWIAAH
ncbi:MAG TPA: ABC transporter substrate-binding protein [Pyrinomonadaceae bacterium]|nr:ABC transporter substrate-binding protein [Pyrinomonadaceae bacterium]